MEIVVPVTEPKLVRRMRDEILEAYLADTVNAYRMGSEGGYLRSERCRTAGGVDSHLHSLNRRA